MPYKALFIGEERSQKAIEMNVRWEDGRLAGKQLFDALRTNGYEPSDYTFLNAFETPELIPSFVNQMPIIAMGKKVQKALTEMGISFIPCVHPASRGKIRRKDRYADHIKTVMSQTSTWSNHV